MFFNPVSVRAGSKDRNMKSLEGKVKLFDGSINRGRGTDNTYYAKAKSLMEMFQLTEDVEHIQRALSCYNEAARLDPENPLYFIERAVCLINLKQDELAQADLEKAKSLPAPGGSQGLYLRDEIDAVESHFNKPLEMKM